MSKICDLTGKKSIVGNSVSFSNKKTKRRFNPNLQLKKFYMPETGEWITLKVSTSAIRTINKKTTEEKIIQLRKALGLDLREEAKRFAIKVDMGWIGQQFSTN